MVGTGRCAPSGSGRDSRRLTLDDPSLGWLIPGMADASIEGKGEGRRKVRVAIAGIGNCASALLQGIDYYRERDPRADEAWGLMHLEMGGYLPGDVEVVAAFDVDRPTLRRPTAPP